MADVNDIIKLTLTYSMPNASIPNNVFKWSLGNLPTANEDILDALEAWVDDFWVPGFRDLAPDTAQLVNGVVDILNLDGTVKENLGLITFNEPGTNGTTVLPAANAVYLLAQTAIPRSRGSKYIPCVSETAVENGELDAAAITAASLMLLAYLANIQVPGAGKLFPGVLTLASNTFTVFNATGAVEAVPAYQRRRKPNVGS